MYNAGNCCWIAQTDIYLINICNGCWENINFAQRENLRLAIILNLDEISFCIKVKVWWRAFCTTPKFWPNSTRLALLSRTDTFTLRSRSKQDASGRTPVSAYWFNIRTRELGLDAPKSTCHYGLRFPASTLAGHELTLSTPNILSSNARLAEHVPSVEVCVADLPKAIFSKGVCIEGQIKTKYGRHATKYVNNKNYNAIAMSHLHSKRCTFPLPLKGQYREMMVLLFPPMQLLLQKMKLLIDLVYHTDYIQSCEMYRSASYEQHSQIIWNNLNSLKEKQMLCLINFPAKKRQLALINSILYYELGKFFSFKILSSAKVHEEIHLWRFLK